MSVKRYDLVGDMDGNCNLNEARMDRSEDGVFVKHKDYAELEQQLAESHRALRAETTAHENTQMQLEKIAAENAGMKEWSPNPHSASMFEAIEKAEELMDDGMPELAMIEAFEILKMKRTPETDAFLAEVRAQGVERLAKAWYAIANETDTGISISDSSRLKYRQRADDAADFANEIRQEFAQ